METELALSEAKDHQITDIFPTDATTTLNLCTQNACIPLPLLSRATAEALALILNLSIPCPNPSTNDGECLVFMKALTFLAAAQIVSATAPLRTSNVHSIGREALPVDIPCLGSRHLHLSFL